MPKNLYSKTRPIDHPYEIWVSRDGRWVWKVLKKWQLDDGKRNARWYCAVQSPYTYGSYEYGDCYTQDVKQHAKRIR